jgi:hypothetical protein
MIWSQYKIAVDKKLTLWEGDENFSPAKDTLYKEMANWKRDSFWKRELGEKI